MEMWEERSRQKMFSRFAANEAARKLIKEIEQQVTQLLQDHRAQLENLAQALLQTETLEHDEIEALINSPAPST